MARSSVLLLVLLSCPLLWDTWRRQTIVFFKICFQTNVQT